MSFQVIFTTKGVLTPNFLKNKKLFFQCYFDFEIVDYGPVIRFSTAPGFLFLKLSILPLWFKFLSLLKNLSSNNSLF